MPAHKVGRLWKFHTSEVDAWVRTGGAGAHDDGQTAHRPILPVVHQRHLARQRSGRCRAHLPARA